MFWRLRAYALPLWVLLSACSSDEVPGDEESSDTGLPEDGLARGIFLTKITVDQGVSIEIFDGAEIPTEQWRTSLIAGRPLFVRALWTVHPQWQPRDIRAEITLHLPTGDIDASKTLTVEGDALLEDVEQSFYWMLPGEFVQADLSFDLRFVDAEEEPSEFEIEDPRPIVEMIPVEIQPGPHVIDVVIVPFDHQLDGEECEGPPVFDEVLQTLYRDHLFIFNPVEEVRLTVREPLVWTEDMKTYGPLLDRLGQLREEDGAKPWQYYFGALNPCDGGAEAGWAGLALIPAEPTQELAHRRVAVGEVYINLGGTAETFVHEIGHTQGRKHVMCDGEANVDADYPHDEGRTNTPGLDLVDWRLHTVNEFDYMTYCGPTWVSDYGWNKVLPIIETLSGWEADGDWKEPEGTVLLASFRPDGTRALWTARGGPDPMGEPVEVGFTAGDEIVATAIGRVTIREDGTTELSVAIPPEWDEVDGFTRGSLKIARSEIKEIATNSKAR